MTDEERDEYEIDLTRDLFELAIRALAVFFLLMALYWWMT